MGCCILSINKKANTLLSTCYRTLAGRTFSISLWKPATIY